MKGFMLMFLVVSMVGCSRTESVQVEQKSQATLTVEFVVDGLESKPEPRMLVVSAGHHTYLVTGVDDSNFWLSLRIRLSDLRQEYELDKADIWAQNSPGEWIDLQIKNAIVDRVGCPVQIRREYYPRRLKSDFVVELWN